MFIIRSPHSFKQDYRLQNLFVIIVKIDSDNKIVIIITVGFFLPCHLSLLLLLKLSLTLLLDDILRT